MNKYEGKEVKFPKLLKLMMEYYPNGVLDLYFVIQDKYGEKLI